MSIINFNLPFKIEHIDGQRCEILKDYVYSNQIIIRELVIVSPPQGAKCLKKLLFSCNPAFITQLFDHRRTSPQCPELSIDFADPYLWIHDIIEDEQSLIAMQWEMHINPSNTLTFLLKKIITFGLTRKNPFDLCCDHLDTATRSIANDPLNPINISIDAELATLTINPVDIICMIFLESSIQHKAGHINCWFSEKYFFFQYGEDVPVPMPPSLSRPRIIQSGRFFTPPQRRSTVLVNNHAPQNLEPPQIKIEEVDLKCPAIKRLHRYVEQGEKITFESAQHAIREAGEKLDYGLKICLLYMIHKWAPILDDSLKLEVLCAASGESASPYPISILKDNYRATNNYSMLLSLIQRQIAGNILSPKRLIPLEIEYSQLLSGPLNMPQLAAKKLDTIKPLVLKYATPSERINYAQAYHLAQYTGQAIQYLREWMNSSNAPEDITHYGLKLAQIMFEHNEPLQSIVNVCTRILEVSPQNTDTLELLAKCLEASNRPDDAAMIWVQCFEQFIQSWEIARIKVGLTPSPDNIKWLQTCHQRCVQTANSLELLLAETDKAPLRCQVYRSHLRLEPNSIRVLAQLLEVLEASHSFYEMAQACLEFLNKNAKTIEPSNEISLRLTLHNIYDVELNRPEEALNQLNIARELAALDTRVITTEIERCRRRGLLQEQVGLRLSLIEALPPNEIIDPTLELVKLYETLNAPVEKILDILRKTNVRAPNHPQILLELRAYLRKTDQLFELCTVLENLARVITDIQARKAILLESSELNEKIGNNQVAQAQYHEALLCSPINPDNNQEFMPQELDKFEPTTNASNPNLTSIILTSRSLSNVSAISSIENQNEVEIELSEPHVSLQTSEHRSLSEFSREGDSYISIPSDFAQKPSAFLFKGDKTSDNDVIAEDQPLEPQINDARIKGNTRLLLEGLLKSIEDIPESERPPRVLQEIGCIYLYDKRDLKNAKFYLESASALSEEIEYGEQTLNALEFIYQSLKMFEKLAEIYGKKCAILTAPDERKKYEVRLAQLCYEKLGETDLAIETLQNIIEKSPTNEMALQQLAQIYIDTQNPFKAIETLEKITKLLPPNSKQMAQHTLRLISLYSDINCTFKSKQLMHDLLRNNAYIDKLAVIELFKRTCREHDDWQELLYILCDEIAYYMKLPREDFELENVLNSTDSNAASGLVCHALREYADVLYKKLKSIAQASNIYFSLLMKHPEAEYPRNVLFEMSEQYPENAEVISKIVELTKAENASRMVQPPFTPKEAEGAKAIQSDFSTAYQLVKNQNFSNADVIFAALEKKINTHRSKLYLPMFVALKQYSRTMKNNLNNKTI